MVAAKGENATLVFRFTTTGGDVCFSAAFVAAGEAAFGVETVVRERTREQAQTAPVQVKPRPAAASCRATCT
jgi:hypothetical protein